MSDIAVRVALGLTRLTEGISAVLLGAIVVVNVLQVFFRYVVGDPLGWTEEVMRYAVVWVTFLASVAAVYRGEHMAIEVIGPFLPPPAQRVLYILVLLCIAAFCAVLVWQGFPLAWRNAAQTSPSAEIPMIVPYVSVAVGGLLILVQVACLLVLLAAGRYAPPSPGGEAPAA